MSVTRKRNPEKMKKISSFVEEYFFEYHRSPTMQKIADEFGVSKSTAYYYINEMAEKGMLSYDGKTITTSSMQKSIHLTKVIDKIASVLGVSCSSLVIRLRELDLLEHRDKSEYVTRILNLKGNLT